MKLSMLGGGIARARHENHRARPTAGSGSTLGIEELPHDLQLEILRGFDSTIR